MKKHIIFMLMLVSIFPLYAANSGQSGSGESNIISQSNVVIQVTGEIDSAKSYNLGFSYTPVPTWNAAPSVVSAVVPLDVVFENEIPYAQNNTNKIFLYWKIVTNKHLRLYLGIEPMDNAGSKLDWQVSWAPFGTTDKIGTGNLSVADTPGEDAFKPASGNFKLVQDLTVPPTVQSIGKSLELKIKTDSLINKVTTGKYVGNIILHVAVE